MPLLDGVTSTNGYEVVSLPAAMRDSTLTATLLASP